MLAGDDQQGTFKILVNPIHQFVIQRFALLLARCLSVDQHSVGELNGQPIVENCHFSHKIIAPDSGAFLALQLLDNNIGLILAESITIFNKMKEEFIILHCISVQPLCNAWIVFSISW